MSCAPSAKRDAHKKSEHARSAVARRSEVSGSSAAVFAAECDADGEDFSELAFDWPGFESGFEPAVGSGGEGFDGELSFSPSELHALTALGVVNDNVESRR